MGNRLTQPWDEETYRAVLEYGPEYIERGRLVWSESERRALKEFLSDVNREGDSSCYGRLLQLYLQAPLSEAENSSEAEQCGDLELFFQALEKIHSFGPGCPDQLIPRGQMILGSFRLLIGKVTSLSDQDGPPIVGPILLPPGVYITLEAVKVEGLSRPKEEKGCEIGECGPQDLKAYLDEILYRLDYICRRLN